MPRGTFWRRLLTVKSRGKLGQKGIKAMSTTMQAIVVSPGSRRPNSKAIELELFDTDGTAYIAPEQAAARADMGALTSTVAAGATPTKAEFDALRTDVSTLQTLVNDLLAKMRTAKQLAP